MTIETLERAQSVYKAYKDAELLLIVLQHPVTRIETNGSSYTIPPELAESVRAAVVATVEQERDRLKAELEAL